MLRFVWRRTPEDKADTHQYVRHIFGAKCSPTGSNYVLRRTLQDNKDSFPLEAKVVERNFYMDDLVISLTASISDPIGFLVPFIVWAKTFPQLLWEVGQGWDEKVPEEIQQEWSIWQKELQSLVEFSVPRFHRLVMVFLTSVQLHLFGDASEEAFCAVAYFRFEYPGGERRCAFVAAKTRVAPVKPQSIPRLELQAVVLLSSPTGVR